ncbi:hypothetical protein QQG91_07255 [Marivivens sp. LCG002]|uniref:hypothetical protein n=1 Tax=Marivivens sp. LCG002 TaxID=3051171 RepID=UPI002555A4D9|nr:hypothetical protein [Marivivens sp. LCG002]WIV49476.1 hypothetical protein QQG91_07255 [Marivivens sp. LCG002]
MRHLISFIRHHKYMSLAFVVALSATMFFAFDVLSDARNWKDPQSRNVDPQVWMTPMYIAHSWKVDPKELGAAIGITERPRKRTTLEDIAKERGVPVAQVILEVQEFLAASSTREKR